MFKNPLAFRTLQEFFTALLEVIVLIGIPVVVLAIIFVGFLFVTAQGNEQKISSAKRALVWTLLGALLILGAQVLATAVEGTVNQLRQMPTAPQEHILVLEKLTLVEKL